MTPPQKKEKKKISYPELRSSNPDGLEENGDTDCPWPCEPPFPAPGCCGGGPSVASWIDPNEEWPNNQDPPDVFIIVDVGLWLSSINLGGKYFSVNIFGKNVGRKYWKYWRFLLK
jgi:hypothetical protein